MRGIWYDIVLFASVIIRLFQLVFSVRTVFFSHNKSAGTVFGLFFQRSEWGLGLFTLYYSSISSMAADPADTALVVIVNIFFSL